MICQSKGQADILKAAELSIFKITMERKAKKYEDRKDLTDYMEPVGEKESSYGSDGRKFSWADVCVCGGHAGIGYYAVLARRENSRDPQNTGRRDIGKNSFSGRDRGRVSCGCLRGNPKRLRVH